MTQSMDRRSFLKGGLALGGTFALSGTLAGCSNNGGASSADKTDARGNIDPVAEYSCDVVVVGAGMAGLSAANSALDSGAGVLLIERQGGIGGGGRGTEGVFAVGSYKQKAQGVTIEPVDIIDIEMNYQHNRADGSRWLDLIANCGDNIKWMEGHGVELNAKAEGYRGQSLVVFHGFASGRATKSYSFPMRDSFIKNGGELLVNTRADQLIIGPDGAVSGLYAKKLNGDHIKVNAGAVILACGGFADSDEFYEKANYPFGDNMLKRLGQPGDGLRLAYSAGAASTLDRFAPMMLPTVRGPLNNGAGVFGIGRDGVVVAARTASSLWINDAGRRFVNEQAAGVPNWQALGHPLVSQKYVFSIFDQALFTEDYSLMKLPYVSAKENQAQLEQRVKENPFNDCFSANTIEELLKKLCAAYNCIDYDTALTTVKQYNDCCTAGADIDFAKPAKFLKPLATPPFYCFGMVNMCSATFGGVATNHSFQAVDPEKTAIPGLYSVGTDSAALWTNIYTINVPCGANANNVNSGRVAGTHAATVTCENLSGSVSSTGDTSPSRRELSWDTPSSMKDGVYTASAQGIDGPIDVTVTVKDNKIADLAEKDIYESEFIGKIYMQEYLIPAILESGSLDFDVDIIGGATISCSAMCDAVEDCLEQAAKN